MTYSKYVFNALTLNILVLNHQCLENKLKDLEAFYVPRPLCLLTMYFACAGKKTNGAMKTSSAGSNSRSPTPSPVDGKHSRFAMLGRLFKPWKWKRKKKSDRFEQTSRSMFSLLQQSNLYFNIILSVLLIMLQLQVLIVNLKLTLTPPPQTGGAQTR